MKNNIKVLYLDSDQKFGKTFLQYLISNNCNIKYCKTLQEAHIEYSNFTPELIIFDEKLNDGSGLNFIKYIKSFNKDIKTIFLSSDSDKSIFAKAINLKIDKFIDKSEYKTVLEQMQDLITTPKENKKKASFFDLGNDFVYDVNTRGLSKGKDKITLTNQETEFLEILIKAQGEFVSTKQLQNSIGVYGETTVETLRTVVKKIRKKTYDEIIQNKSRIGYRVNLYKNVVQPKNSNDMEITTFDKSILILKWNKQQNDMLAYQLSKFGFRCESAYTIEEAKYALEESTFDYLVSGLNLPDGYGVDLIRENKNNLKVIILADLTDIHYKEYLYFKGILDFILLSDDTSYLAQNIYNTIYKIEINLKHNNILVIEKSKKITEQVKDLLLPRNYKISIINDLSEAFVLIQKGFFNMIILDISYDESFEFIYNVKSQISSMIPFVVLTETNRDYETVRDAFKSGASECLRKPLFAEEFILKVDQLMEQAKLMYQLIDQKNFLKTYQSIVDKTTIVSKTNIKGNITYVNDMFCKISGYEEDELLGKPHNIVRDKDMPSETFKELWETIKTDKQIWSGIVSNRRKDGSRYIVQTFIMPITDKKDKVTEFIALRNNITDLYTLDKI